MSEEMSEIERNATRKVQDALQALQQAMREYRVQLDNKPPNFLLGNWPPAIPQPALKGCKVFTDRARMLRSFVLPEGGKVAEVGTLQGHWAELVLAQKAPEELHLFDVTFAPLIDAVRSDRRVTLHEGDSSTQLAKFPDGYFDWIYIDGDHAYEGVCKDARVAEQKIRKDGFLVFNDYTQWSPLEAIPYGIAACVNEILARGDWRVAAIALTPSGYYDIAITRGILPVQAGKEKAGGR